MAVEIRVPPLGESVIEATVGRWTKSEGDAVSKDEILVELETDKITVEVAAQQDGVLERIAKQEGETVGVNELLATLQTDGAGPPQAQERAAEPATEEKEAAGVAGGAPEARQEVEAQTSPAARAIAAEHGLDLGSIQGSGPNGRITKEDVLNAVEERQQRGSEAEEQRSRRAAVSPPPARPSAPPREREDGRDGRVTRERITRRRLTIARRLLEAQQTTASLTTFNEVDLSRVMDLRKRRQEEFVKKHGVKVGFMSFFTKAVIAALKQFPRLNAEIDLERQELVLKHHYDIGIAVGAEEGLVVPVVRDADKKSFAELEK
jgi:2-oxoglutarate dehydrogenase E2 component (dihydrolipoamide succinyltransferase)